MRLTVFLSHRYIKGHPRQSVGAVLCVALFFSAVLTTLLYRNCAEATFQYEHWETYGSDFAAIYQADPQKVAAKLPEIQRSNSGLVRVTRKLNVMRDDKPVYFGSMDSNAVQLKAILPQNGRFPTSPEEIAVESSTLQALYPNVKIGDSITLNFSGSKKGTYRLVGILKDYIEKWQGYDGTKTSIKYPPPGILTAQNSGPVLYEHVLCGAKSPSGVYFQDNLGGKAVPNSNSGSDDSLTGRRRLLNWATFPLLLFFAVVMEFGILNLIKFIMRERRRNMKLLWNIGISRRRLTFLHYFQGLELFAAAAVLSVLISPLLCWVLIQISSLSGDQLILSFHWTSFLIAYLVGFAGLFLALASQRRNLFAEREKTRAVSGNLWEYRSVSTLWRNAVKKKNRSQNVTTALLVGFCMVLAVFGVLCSVIIPWDDYGGAEKAQKDYELYVGGGQSGEQNFNISLPRNMGVSSSDLQALYHTDGLQVNYALVQNMTKQFFLVEKRQKNEYLDYLIKEPKTVYSYTDTKAIVQAGGHPGDQMVEADTEGLDWPSLKNLYPSFSAGSLDESKFKSGEEVLAPDSHCKVGDTFTIITPLVAGGLPSENLSKKITFHVSHAAVAATYHPRKDEGEPVILSGEFIMNTDPSSRYEDVALTNLKKNDPGARAGIEKIVTNITAKSQNVTMKNLIRDREEYAAMTRSMRLQTAISVFAFLVIVLLAFYLSAYVNVETNLHSYLLMRTIGVKQKVIKRLLWRETWGPVWKGALAGTVLVFAFAIFTISPYPQYPRNLFLPPMCAAAIITFGLICGACTLAVKKPVDALLKRSITEELNSVE